MADDLDCEKCDHAHLPSDGGHCYMFLKKPKGFCGQHTALPRPTPEEVRVRLATVCLALEVLGPEEFLRVLRVLKEEE